MEVVIQAIDKFTNLPQEKKAAARKKAEKVIKQEVEAFFKEKNASTDPWIEFIEHIDEHAVDTGIKDLAVNHDHYLYGVPKQSRNGFSLTLPR